MRFISLAKAAFCFALLAVGALAAQQTAPPSAEQRRAGGQKTITGCLMKGDQGFVIKAADGTYALNTDRDLSSFVGKQVRIDSTWDVTGTLTNNSMADATSGPAPSTPPAATGGSTGTPAFVGDLRMHITGTVVGDCPAPK